MKLFTKSLFILNFLLVSAFSASAQDHRVGDIVFSLNNGQGQISAGYAAQVLQKGLTVVNFTFKGTANRPLPSQLTIKWSVPLIGITGYWTPNSNLPRFIAMRASLEANLASQAPVAALFGDHSLNRYTFSLSDAFHKTVFNLSVKEEEARLNCSFNINLAEHEQKQDYQVGLLLDVRQQPYHESLNHVASWWAAMPAYKPAYVPPAANLPVYSTWYSYHQNFTEQQLLDECVQAKALGYETIIVDDGWQTLDTHRGYAYTGDWEPERIADMQGFAKKVHDTGMKLMLWYSVPFIGYQSKSFKQFEGKYLYRNDRLSAAVLDPRYPQVRDFIVSKYVKDLKEWNLDGFKLDFIDNFTNEAEDLPPVTAEADFTSLYEGIDQLMVAIKNALTAVKPDILIEFRQSYTGPAMRKYGNMFRAGDCPNSALTNRIRTTDIKLLAGNTAVHSDMLMWNYQEPAPLAAQQFSNILFSVPQLSVRLKEIPVPHLNMVRFYTRFWLDHKEVLLDGDFEALSPELNYPLLQSTKNRRMVVGLYADMPVTLKKGIANLALVNAKDNEEVLFKLPEAAKYDLEIFDCEGNLMKKGRVSLKKGIHLFQVPPSGIMKLVKM